MPDPRIARVTEVVDGDTIRVRFVSGTVRTVRYIGIDAPETPSTGDAPECFGREATRANGRLVPVGERVRVVYDQARQDRYGRLLAYVYRARDDLFVNDRLLADGYATVLTVPPNVSQVATFIRSARMARERGVGLWSHCDTPGP